MGLRTIAKRLQNNAIRYEPAGRPIVVLASRRGGSTMALDAIAANKGTLLANEPYAMFPVRPNYPAKARWLDTPPHSQFFALQGDALAAFDRYTAALLGGELRDLVGSRRATELRARRVCLKVLNAPFMLDRFADHHGAEVLVLLRHPAGQALSVMRQGWDWSITAYLARREEVTQFLSDAQLDLAEDALRLGDPWRLALIDWCITTTRMRTACGPRVTRVLYEDVVRDPDAFVDGVLMERFGLPDRDRMRAAVREPSHSSMWSTGTGREAIRKGDAAFLAEGWRAKVDEDMTRVGREVLDAFEVEQYRF